MGRPAAPTKQLTAAVVNNLATSQALGAAGNLNLNGAAAGVLDTQRRVLITSAGDDHLLTWTVTGTNDGGAPIKDSFKGGNIAAVASNLDFKTVTQISGDRAAAGNVQVGTNTVGSTPWQRFNPHIAPPFLSLAAQLMSGAGTATVEYTYDEFLPDVGAQAAITYAPANFVPNALALIAMENMNASADGAINFVISGWRLTVNTGTGLWKLTGTQAGLAGP